ncbi:hypothetical protein GCM10009560_32250 [Nonomuraea longicatena]|uniref:Uncharacterized protein n=1 Tax=Nonomuraea longicatena TaxID=83682 RepID=A0ABP3ZYP5_9ACTN
MAEFQAVAHSAAEALAMGRATEAAPVSRPSAMSGAKIRFLSIDRSFRPGLGVPGAIIRKLS